MEESLTESSGDFEHAFDEADDGGFDKREVKYFEDENDPIEVGKLCFREDNSICSSYSLFCNCFQFGISGLV